MPLVASAASYAGCTDDLALYCMCDGTTVSGSGSCPPGIFRHRGARQKRACANVDAVHVTGRARIVHAVGERKHERP